MNINQRQRSEKQRDTLQAEWDLRNEKLKQLRLALAIEAGAAVKFQLQQQIQAEETELKRLNDELHTIEQALYTVNLVESPTIEPDPDTPNLVKSPPIDPTPSPPIVVKPPILPKADYHQLRDLLEKKAWQEADQETVQIILQVAKRQKEGSLKAKDLKNFSCSG